MEDLGRYLHRVFKAYVATPLTNIPSHRQTKTVRVRETVKGLLEQSQHTYFDVYNPAEHTAPGSPHSATEVLETISCGC